MYPSRAARIAEAIYQIRHSDPAAGSGPVGCRVSLTSRPWFSWEVEVGVGGEVVLENCEEVVMAAIWGSELVSIISAVISSHIALVL